MDEQAKTPTTPVDSDDAAVNPPAVTPSETPSAQPPAVTPPAAPAAPAQPPAAAQPPTSNDDDGADFGMDQRLERLGGEPAPVITPEEFARLQRQGQVHIDERGRVKTARRSGAEAGVSLRKRRAWYAT